MIVLLNPKVAMKRNELLIIDCTTDATLGDTDEIQSYCGEHIILSGFGISKFKKHRTVGFGLHQDLVWINHDESEHAPVLAGNVVVIFYKCLDLEFRKQFGQISWVRFADSIEELPQEFED